MSPTRPRAGCRAWSCGGPWPEPQRGGRPIPPPGPGRGSEWGDLRCPSDVRAAASLQTTASAARSVVASVESQRRRGGATRGPSVYPRAARLIPRGSGCGARVPPCRHRASRPRWRTRALRSRTTRATGPGRRTGRPGGGWGGRSRDDVSACLEVCSCTRGSRSVGACPRADGTRRSDRSGDAPSPVRPSVARLTGVRGRHRPDTARRAPSPLHGRRRPPASESGRGTRGSWCARPGSPAAAQPAGTTSC